MTNKAVRLTGIAAVALAAIALTGCGSNDDTAAAVQASIDSLQSRVAALESAQAESKAHAQVLATSSASTATSTPTSVADLTATSPASTPTAASPTAASASFEASVRRTGPLKLLTGSVDLDAPASSPSWTGDTPDVESTASALVPLNGAQMVRLGKGTDNEPLTADLPTCSTAIYSTQPIKTVDLRQGDGICVKTSDGRFAALTVLEGYSNSFSATSYELPG